ncbi:hypothetical protein GCM10010272_47260 [Streptomyces lateritius]|nr:hypothetical protein GCM10010272_47260 [Streptomyces lateritius]
MTTGPSPEDPGGVTRRRLARTPVRGREAELAFVEARLDSLARGEGGIVRVEGPPGSGRTRILTEAAASAKRRGTRVFHGGADPDDRSPLGPLLEGLLSGEVADAARLRDLATSPGQRFWLLQELGDRLREAARGGPLLIVLDDLQWCDDLTLLAFHTVAAGLSSEPILWLVAVRGGSVPPGVRTTLDRIQRAGAYELVLGPLGDLAIARITEDVLGAVPDPDVLRVARRAEGVPLLLVELLDAMREEGAVTIENGMARLPAGPGPVGRLSSVRRRLDLLSDAARELVETTAAMGSAVTVRLLAEALGRPSATLISAVREALDSDLLAERGDHLEFRHALIREAVEAGLPLSARHNAGKPRRHAAEALPESAASPAGPPVPPTDSAPTDSAPTESTSTVGPAVDDGRRPAASDLTATAAVPDAEPGPGAPESGLSAREPKLSTREPGLSAREPGLSGREPDHSARESGFSAREPVATDGPERPRGSAGAVPLLRWTGPAARAHHPGAPAPSSGGLGPEAEARTRLGLARRLFCRSDFSEAVRHARTGAGLPGVPAALRARLTALLCLALSMSGELDAAEQAVAEALAAAEATGDRAAGATATVAASVVYFHRMDWSSAVRQADRAAALAAGREADPSAWIPEALWQGFLWNAAGRSAEALALAEAGVRNTRNQGRAAATRMWLANHARALLDAGRLTDARAAAEAATAVSDELGPGDFADAVLLPTLMRVALHTGDQEAVRAYAAEALRLRSADAPLLRDAGAWTTALTADSEGRPDRAMALVGDVTVALVAERPSLVGPLDPADAPVLVRMALRAGAHERAAAAADVAERRAALNPDVMILAATAAHARGLLANDLGHLLRAVRLYEDCPRPLARASALEDAGRKLAVTRRSEAVPYLDKALALYTRAGAERDALRVRRRLRAAGVRRRLSPAGHVEEWPELTVAEAGVARLVAQGLTNARVAEHLSLSPHTVGSHLRRVFTKLDITSRGELSRLAATRDSGE